jgi:putative mRNA 3-end processing factor
VTVSLHPAGHILGSAQIRVEHRGEVWVASGDYKTQAEPSCAPFEPVRCNVFITESTFGLPIYRWRPQAEIFAEISSWWRACRESERTAVLFCYSLGKAQRILAGVDAGIGPIVAHYSVEKFLPLYAAQGVKLPAVVSGGNAEAMKAARGCGLVVAPMSTDESAWLSGMGPVSRAFASGWMQVRGARRRQALDRGFTLSDHADWPGLLASIRATGAERVLVTHGYTTPLCRWLEENGWQSGTLRTQFGAADPTREDES